MAGQTQTNLQSCAMAAVVVALTKDAETCPWQASHGRLSELAIEQFFGALRSQSGNSQLTSRAYFRASARHAMQMSKQLNQDKPLPGREAALSNAEFLVSFFHISSGCTGIPLNIFL